MTLQRLYEQFLEELTAMESDFLAEGLEFDDDSMTTLEVTIAELKTLISLLDNALKDEEDWDSEVEFDDAEDELDEDEEDDFD